VNRTPPRPATMTTCRRSLHPRTQMMTRTMSFHFDWCGDGQARNHPHSHEIPRCRPSAHQARACGLGRGTDAHRRGVQRKRTSPADRKRSVSIRSTGCHWTRGRAASSRRRALPGRALRRSHAAGNGAQESPGCPVRQWPGRPYGRRERRLLRIAKRDRARAGSRRRHRTAGCPPGPQRRERRRQGRRHHRAQDRAHARWDHDRGLGRRDPAIPDAPRAA